jgi:hypothetical protein
MIQQILKYATKPVGFRYPEAFNIPDKGRKPLKQYNSCYVKHDGVH